MANAATVSSLLDALGVAVHRLDQVKPDPQSALAPGTRVRVIRVRKYRLREVEPLPFSTLIQNSKDLELGQVKVLTPGIPGQARVTYLITSRNGREVSREVLTEVVLTSPTDQVEQHGTTAPSLQGGVDYGDASWYDWSGCGSGYHAAHRTLPFGTLVTVTNLDNGKTVTVTINDRGPYITGPGSGRSPWRWPRPGAWWWPWSSTAR